jgi:hypothetical protein
MSQVSSNPLSQLLTALAEMYATENRSGGDQAARELLRAANQPCELPDAHKPPLEQALNQVLTGDPHPLSALIRAAQPWIAWGDSDLGDRIKDDIAREMMLVEFVGPDGMFPSDAVRVGLWLQAAGVNYTTRSHTAEETFIILGGQAIWQSGENGAETKGCGAMIHHPSNMPHSDRTTNAPLLAAWRWSGDIAIENYILKS